MILRITNDGPNTASAVCTGTAPASFVTPIPTAAPVSFVVNPYFSFPYVATSFGNPGPCSPAVSQCRANYAACTGQLDGQALSGSYGVTIVVPGNGGTTVVGGGGGITYNPASATSICTQPSIQYPKAAAILHRIPACIDLFLVADCEMNRQ